MRNDLLDATHFSVPYGTWGLKELSIFMIKVVREVDINVTWKGSLFDRRVVGMYLLSSTKMRGMPTAGEPASPASFGYLSAFFSGSGWMAGMFWSRTSLLKSAMPLVST